MKTLKKVTTLALVASLVMSMSVTGVSAAEVPVNNSNASADNSASAASIAKEESGSTLAKYYSTNAAGFGANKTISVDGDLSDWDSSMLIAQGAANDDPRVYRPNSMYELGVDLYALYGAYDDNNVYLMWEMTNVQDIVAPSDDYPLSQGILWQTQEFPFFIAFDTGKADTAIGKNGALTTGGTIWNSGMTFENSFNKLISINTKGGNGPWVYGGDSTGLNPVELLDRSTSKITMKYGKGILSKNVYGIDGAYGTNNNRVPGDVCNESAAWVDFNSKGHKTDSMDFFYELSIPYNELGITKSDVQNNGIGVMLIGTMGMSAMDCLPGDPVMTDQADLDDAANSQENNSFEKSDEDFITAPFARIGKGEGPTQPTQPTNPTSPTQPTAPTDPTQPVNNVTGQKQITVKAGDVVEFTVDANTTKNIGAYRITTKYDSSAFILDTTKSSDGVKTLGETIGMETVNTDVAGQIKAAALAPADKPYTADKGTTLQTVYLKATKAGTFTISYTIDEMIDDNVNDLVANFKPVNGVTITENATISGETPTNPTAPTSPTSPTNLPSDLTETKNVTVHKGDLVNFWVEVELPSTSVDAAGWTIDMYYDTAVFAPNKKFAGGYGYAAGTDAVNAAIASNAAYEQYPGVHLSAAEFKNGEVSITEANPNGLKFKGKTTKVVCIQLEAIADSTTAIGYRMRDLVDTNLKADTLINNHQPAGGAKFALKNNVVCNHVTPDKDVKIFGDINLTLQRAAGSNALTGIVDLQAGTYSFKVNEFGTELGYNYTFTDKATITFSPSYKSSSTLKATGGTYTFTYDENTNKLTITHKPFSGVKIVGENINLDLTKSSENVYTKTVDLKAGTYSFKINEFGTELGFGITFTDKISNLKYSSSYKASSTLKATGGTYTFSYNTATDSLTITYKAVASVKIFGDIDLELAKSTTANVYTGKVDLAAGKYTFKVNEFGTELGYNYTFTDKATIPFSAAYKSSSTLNATGGTYTFTYNTSTDKLTVSYQPVAKNVKLFGDLNLELAQTATANVYSTTKEIAAGKYTFKVNEFGTEMGGNYAFTNQATGLTYNSAYKAVTTFTATGGTYTFTYNASTDKLTVTRQATEKVVKLFGDLNLELAKTATANVYSATKDIAAGKYTFKVNEFGTEMGGSYAFTNQATGLTYNSAYKAVTTFTATGGTYTFTYNASTDKLTISYQAPGVKIFGDLNFELAKTATANVYSATKDLAAGKYTFKVNELGTELGCNFTFTDNATIGYNSAYKAATTLNATGGTYTFTYNASTDKLTVTRKAPGVKIFGDLNLELAKTATANVYSVKVNLKAGKYTFKVNELGTELGCNFTFTDNATVAYNSAYKASTTLNATGGTYTFTYNASTDKLTVLKNA